MGCKIMTIYKYIDGEQFPLSEEELREFNARELSALEDYRKQLVSSVKNEAGVRILEIAPVFKQINLLREKPDDVIFTQIDSIRQASNTIEQVIAGLDNEELRSFEYSDLWPNFNNE